LEVSPAWAKRCHKFAINLLTSRVSVKFKVVRRKTDGDPRGIFSQ